MGKFWDAQPKWAAKCPSIIQSWTSVSTVSIQDVRLSILAYVLKLVVVILFALNVYMNKADRFLEVPEGFPTFWFDSPSILHAAQNVSQPYCSNAVDYEYYDPSAEDDFWNDRDATCGQYDYGEILTMSPTYAQITTYVKQTQSKKGPCTGNSYCSSIPGSRPATEVRIKRPDGNGFICSCGRSRDTFVLGVDKLIMVLQHAFKTSSNDLAGLSGSSTYTSSTSGDKKKAIRTCLRNDNQDSACTNKRIKKENFSKCCRKEFAPGEDMRFSVEEWISFSGISLDERLTSKVMPSAEGEGTVGGKYPFHRVAGAKLRFELKYYGDKSDDDITCLIMVSQTDAWNSFGSQMIYRSYDPTGATVSEYFDNYRRGVSFQFVPMGQVSAFDPKVLLMNLVAGLVFLHYVDQVVAFVATWLLPEKKVYANAMNAKNDYSLSLAKFGVNAALACTAFKIWDTSSTQGESKSKISADELTKVYKDGGLTDELAQKFSKLVLDESQHMKSLTDGADRDGLTCEDLVKFLSSGLVNLDTVRETQASPASKATKVLPEKGEESANGKYVVQEVSPRG